MSSTRYVAKSVVVHELIQDVQLARGRLYFWRAPGARTRLGALAKQRLHGDPPVQVFLHRKIGIRIRVLAEPRHWYSMHRRPAIVEVSRAKDRVLVRFAAYGLSGSFHGTCLR